jgi:hypothetical protein
MTRKFLLLISVFAILSAGLHGQEIHIHADQVIAKVSRHLTGACIEDVNHEIYGGLYSQMIFGEGFQEPAPQATIAGFTAFGGRWSVEDSVLHMAADDGSKLIRDGKPLQDGTVNVQVMFGDRKAGNAGLILRAEKLGIGADRFIGYEIALDPERQQLRLARHRNNFELIRDVPCEVPVGRWVPLAVRLAGSVIEIEVFDKTVLRHDDGERALPAGAIGLRGWRRDASFRNLRLTIGSDVETVPFAKTDTPAEISGMWWPVRKGSAKGRFALITDHPFAGVQSQQVTFESGDGAWGIENQGLNRWGMNFVAGKPYEGYVWVRAEKPTELFVALESRDGSRNYADVSLNVSPGDWRRLDFTLTPTATDTTGRFALLLKRPGSVTIGHVFVHPGDWGRYKSLPVRRDVAEGLIDQGITVLRYGGSMVNDSEYRWKKMIGPRDRRPPYRGHWYRYSSNGWGIVDFMDFCEAAGFEYVPALDVNESPQDLADFVEYAKGPAESDWGRKRVADGHPKPYRLPYIEIGNEERVDENYAAKFDAIARAIWAKDRDVILVVGDFAYDRPIVDPMKFTGAASRITSLKGHADVLALARKFDREVWFDVHVDTNGPGASPNLNALPSFIDAIGRIAGGAKHKVVVFELNAGNHSMRRALGNALAINRIERDGRVQIVTSANGLQPDGQNDNGWDQGLLFLNPSRVWLQPPGYVTQMMSRNFSPQVVRCDVTGVDRRLDATAKRDSAGKALVLQVVNPGNDPIAAAILLDGFSPSRPVAELTELFGPLGGVNVADKPDAVVPRRSEWNNDWKEGKATHTFPACSFTVIRWR